MSLLTEEQRREIQADLDAERAMGQWTLTHAHAEYLLKGYEALLGIVEWIDDNATYINFPDDTGFDETLQVEDGLVVAVLAAMEHTDA